MNREISFISSPLLLNIFFTCALFLVTLGSTGGLSSANSDQKCLKCFDSMRTQMTTNRMVFRILRNHTQTPAPPPPPQPPLPLPLLAPTANRARSARQPPDHRNRTQPLYRRYFPLSPNSDHLLDDRQDDSPAAEMSAQTQTQTPFRIRPVSVKTNTNRYRSERRDRKRMRQMTSTSAPTTTTSTTTTTAEPIDDYYEYEDDYEDDEYSDDYALTTTTTTTTTTTRRPQRQHNRRRGRGRRRRFRRPRPTEPPTTTTTTTTTTLSPNYVHRPDGRVIDYLADPNFPYELKGADLTEYPFYVSIPESDFNCKGRVAGYYADIELKCQVYHHCATQIQKYDFLCPNYTLFDQTTFTCRFINTVDCLGSESHYNRNNELYPPESTTSGATDNTTPLEL